jgi:hypothetical protein
MIAQLPKDQEKKKEGKIKHLIASMMCQLNEMMYAKFLIPIY